MCTSITYSTNDHYFGRNFDYEISYQEVVTIILRNYPLKFQKVKDMDNHLGMFGIAEGIADCPLYYDATNEKDISMAGLNFSGYTDYKEFKEGKIEYESVSQFFHILGSVEQQKELCELENNSYEYIIYYSCCNVDKGIYYYRTYGNSQITAVDMNKENLNGSKTIVFPIINDQEIYNV